MLICQSIFTATPCAQGVQTVIARDEKTGNPFDVLLEERFLSDEGTPKFFASTGECQQAAQALTEKHSLKFDPTFKSFSNGMFGNVISLPRFRLFLT